ALVEHRFLRRRGGLGGSQDIGRSLRGQVFATKLAQRYRSMGSGKQSCFAKYRLLKNRSSTYINENKKRPVSRSFAFRYYLSSATNGRSAMIRARLIAIVNL